MQENQQRPLGADRLASHMPYLLQSFWRNSPGNCVWDGCSEKYENGFVGFHGIREVSAR